VPAVNPARLLALADVATEPVIEAAADHGLDADVAVGVLEDNSKALKPLADFEADGSRFDEHLAQFVGDAQGDGAIAHIYFAVKVGQ